MSSSRQTRHHVDTAHSDCHGCGLCTLVCPVWQQKADIRYTPHGIAKSLQADAEPDEQTPLHCILCGACASICPQDIDLYQLMLQARKNASYPVTSLSGSTATNNSIPANITLLLASRSLRENSTMLTRIINCLGGPEAVTLAEDGGDDIFELLIKGDPVSQERLQAFTGPLQNAGRIITDNGLTSYKLRQWMPGKNITSIGHAISKLAHVRNKLGEGDFYVIDSNEYNTNHARMLTYYRELQNDRGCKFNLDLHRLALPTGSRYATSMGHDWFDTTAQGQWLLQGRDFERIVVEDPEDLPLLTELSNRPVLHISELSS